MFFGRQHSDEPDEGVIAIGSGGMAAQAAATALLNHADALKLSVRDIVQESMKIAANICVYTNDVVSIEEL